MKCLSTRTRGGLRFRRYERPDGRRVTTVEVPLTVVKGVGMTRVRSELEAWQRGEKIRDRRARIEALLRDGWKPTAIAHEVGVTDTRVRQIKKELTTLSPGG